MIWFDHQYLLLSRLEQKNMPKMFLTMELIRDFLTYYLFQVISLSPGEKATKNDLLSHFQ